MKPHDIVIFGLMIIAVAGGSLMSSFDVRGGIVMLGVATTFYGLIKVEENKDEEKRNSRRNNRR